MGRPSAEEKSSKAWCFSTVPWRNSSSECSFAQRAPLEEVGSRGVFGKDVIVPDASRISNFQGISFSIDHLALLEQVKVMRGVRDLHVALTYVASRCKGGEGACIAEAIISISVIEVMSSYKDDSEALHQPDIVG